MMIFYSHNPDSPEFKNIDKFVRWFQYQVAHHMTHKVEKEILNGQRAQHIAAYDEKFCQENGLVNPFPGPDSPPLKKSENTT